MIGTTGFMLRGDLSHISLTSRMKLIGCSNARSSSRSFPSYPGRSRNAFISGLHPIRHRHDWPHLPDRGPLGMGRRRLARQAGHDRFRRFRRHPCAWRLRRACGGYVHRSSHRQIPPDGKANIVPPSNLPLASVGAFILWFGWFGFNSGSTLSATNGTIGHIAVTTMLSAAAGGAACILFTMFRYKKADPPMVINGALAGLVGITAGCAFVSDAAAMLIGASLRHRHGARHGMLEKQRHRRSRRRLRRPRHERHRSARWPSDCSPCRDDKGAAKNTPVCSTAADGICLACRRSVSSSSSVWGFALTWLSFLLIKRIMPVRVSKDEELIGLDVGIHGVPAYNQDHDFLDVDQLKTRG